MTNTTGFQWMTCFNRTPCLLPGRGLDPLGPFLLQVRWKGHLCRMQKQESGIWLPPVEEACHLDATGGSPDTVWFTTPMRTTVTVFLRGQPVGDSPKLASWFSLLSSQRRKPRKTGSNLPQFSVDSTCLGRSTKLPQSFATMGAMGMFHTVAFCMVPSIVHPAPADLPGTLCELLQMAHL